MTDCCIYLFVLRFSIEDQDDHADEMTKAGGAVEEEELASFTPKSPISRPYIPDDQLNAPTAYPETHNAFNEANAKYEAKLRKPLYLQSIYSSQVLQPPVVACLVSCTILSRSALPSLHFLR